MKRAKKNDKSEKTKKKDEKRDTSHDEVGSGRSYFESHKGSVKTTNLTLGDLNITGATELEEATNSLKNSLEAEQKVQEDNIKSRFSQFLYMLEAQHSILFYGYGSKKALLDEFAIFISNVRPVFVINGFNPTIGLRNLFAQIASDIVQLKNYQKRSLLDYVTAITEAPDANLALIIHNIDGPSLRTSEAQSALSMLSRGSGIMMAASIDHVNAPLLWDGSFYSRYSWAWIKADTFRPYDVETVYCSKPLLQGGTERRVEGAIALLSSLSERARQVFKLLADWQLGQKSEEGNDETKGSATKIVRTTFNELFKIARDQFLASDPVSLRVILTELQTHDLLQTRRGVDAAEQIWLPLQNTQLQEIVDRIAMRT